MSSSVSSASHPSTAPRWLDVDEQKAWRAWLYSAQLLMDRLDRELTHETGTLQSVEWCHPGGEYMPSRMKAATKTKPAAKAPPRRAARKDPERNRA